ncbi:hypothetical protein KC367_g4316 [Hortaea werneckii]|nr:hypothetical protein KC367_g4316 [Hortaea werneckii]
MEGSDVAAEELGLKVGKLIVKGSLVKDNEIEDIVVEELVSSELVIDELRADERVVKDPVVEMPPEGCASPVSEGFLEDIAPSSVWSTLDVLAEDVSLFPSDELVLDPETLAELLEVELIPPAATEDEESAGPSLIDVCKVKESDEVPGCSEALLGIMLLADIVEDAVIVD